MSAFLPMRNAVLFAVLFCARHWQKSDLAKQTDDANHRITVAMAYAGGAVSAGEESHDTKPKKHQRHELEDGDSVRTISDNEKDTGQQQSVQLLYLCFAASQHLPYMLAGPRMELCLCNASFL